MISINGLTERQVDLLDAMWAFEELADMEEWKSTLDVEDQQECDRLIRLVLIESMDELLQENNTYPDARKVLLDIMRK
jgi:hypothetical protein